MYGFEARVATGLKPYSLIALYAALKGRSSTVALTVGRCP